LCFLCLSFLILPMPSTTCLYFWLFLQLIWSFATVDFSYPLAISPRSLSFWFLFFLLSFLFCNFAFQHSHSPIPPLHF
jgi:hypothetical protein